MSIVLIKQYKETENQSNEELQVEFTKSGVDTVIVPYGLSVEWLPGIGTGQIAVINIDTSESVRLSQHVKAAEKLKKDLEALVGYKIQAIILPADTDVEVMPVS